METVLLYEAAYHLLCSPHPALTAAFKVHDLLNFVKQVRSREASGLEEETK